MIEIWDDVVPREPKTTDDLIESLIRMSKISAWYERYLAGNYHQTSRG